jgi:hypothetical protein
MSTPDLGALSVDMRWLQEIMLSEVEEACLWFLHSSLVVAIFVMLE